MLGEIGIYIAHVTNWRLMEQNVTLSEVDVIIAIITVVGVILTYSQIREMRKQQLLEKITKTFSAVCKLPAPEVAKYDQVYKEIFSYYGFNNENIPNNLFVIDKEYFARCVEEHYVTVHLDKSLVQYKFPLICRKNWLKSNDDKLQIKKDGLCDFSQLKDEDNPLYEPATDFLKISQIESYPAFLASIGKQIWDAKTFDLCSIDEKNHTLQLRFVLGSYFSYVNYYDLISKELYFYIYTSRSKEFSKRALRKLLPKNFILRNSVNLNNVFEFQNRPVKLGINVFVLMKKDEDRYCTFIQKRGKFQVEYPSFYTVAPAGTFQPLSEFDKDTIQSQFHFPFTVLRELLEEVYDLEKADRNRDVDPFEIFRIEKISGFSPGRSLLNADEISNGIPFNNDKYEIIPTGFLIDLVSLKPELTVLLHIKDSEVYKKGKNNVEGNWEGSVKEFDIESESFVSFLNQNLNIDSFSPAGTVALAEGLDYYFTKIKK